MRRVHRPTEGDHKKPKVLFDNLRKPPRCLCFRVLVLFAIRPRDLDTTEKMGRCVFALGPIVTRAQRRNRCIEHAKKKGVVGGLLS